MNRLSTLCFFLFCAFQVNGHVILGALEKVVNDVKSGVEADMRNASNQAKSTAESVLTGINLAIQDSKTWLDKELDNQIDSVTDRCKPLTLVAKNNIDKSLWKCLQLAQVVTDGVNIASSGFGVAADILGSLDNFLESLTACIVGPMQTTSQSVACYLSALGTIATGVAQNIEQVEKYIDIVKRDVEDINASIALCRNETLVNTLQEIADCRI